MAATLVAVLLIGIAVAGRRLGSPGPAASAVASTTATPSAPAPAALVDLVDLLEATAAADAVYGVEPLGDSPYHRFDVVRVDAATLAVTRSAVIDAAPGDLVLGESTVDVVAGGELHRFHPGDLAALPPFRSPRGPLTGPAVADRFGVWAASGSAMTRFLDSGPVESGDLGAPVCALAPDDASNVFGGYVAVVRVGDVCSRIAELDGLNLGTQNVSSPGLFTATPIGELGFGAVGPDGAGGHWVAVPTGHLAQLWHLAGGHLTDTGWFLDSGMAAYTAAGVTWVSSGRGLSCVTRAGALAELDDVPGSHVLAVGARLLRWQPDRIEAWQPDPRCAVRSAP